MLREMLQGKLHRAAITACRLEYAGSLTVDLDLIERVGLLVHQKIQLLNCNNGNRLETYLIAGERGKREFIVNGAAARLNYVGDRVIVAAFAIYSDDELKTYHPKVLVLNERNEVVDEKS
ncbi:MAG: aspartate 1-decarboxylase [Planctomycetes bacterium]|nr:aspartate 1-decarboxylase [Planctomycetota bacterium]